MCSESQISIVQKPTSQGLHHANKTTEGLHLPHLCFIYKYILLAPYNQYFKYETDNMIVMYILKMFWTINIAMCIAKGVHIIVPPLVLANGKGKGLANLFSTRFSRKSLTYGQIQPCIVLTIQSSLYNLVQPAFYYMLLIPSFKGLTGDV